MLALSVTGQTDSLTISQEAYNQAINSYNAGTDLFYQKKYESALPLLKVAVELNPHNADYWFALSSNLSGLDRLEDAYSSCSKALELEANQSDYLLLRANILFKQKKYEAAVSDYTDALKYQDTSEIPVNEGHVYFNRGNCWLYLKNYRSAKSDFDAALEAGYELANVFHNRATALLRIGKKNEACVDWQKAIDLGSPISKKSLDKYCE